MFLLCNWLPLLATAVDNDVVSSMS